MLANAKCQANWDNVTRVGKGGQMVNQCVQTRTAALIAICNSILQGTQLSCGPLLDNHVHKLTDEKPPDLVMRCMTHEIASDIDMPHMILASGSEL